MSHMKIFVKLYKLHTETVAGSNEMGIESKLTVKKEMRFQSQEDIEEIKDIYPNEIITVDGVNYIKTGVLDCYQINDPCCLYMKEYDYNNILRGNYYEYMVYVK